MGQANDSFMAVDVGGTHVRVALAHRATRGRVHITNVTTYVGAEYSSLGNILCAFMAAHATPIDHCVLACAGYRLDSVVVNNNLPWVVDTDQLRNALGLQDLSSLNDFEALAYATKYIDERPTTLLSTCSKGNDIGPVIIVGPGTGLGSSVFVPGTPRSVVLVSEAGQINLAPGTELEMRVLAILARADPYVSYEQVLSGPGLINLYRALGECRNEPAPLDDPEAITRSAQLGDDGLTRQTLDTFCALLGSFVGNMAMLYNASGGVYLAGGVVSHIRDFLLQSDFLERFLAKGQTRPFLERVPVRLIEHGPTGIVGAVNWYLQKLDSAIQRTDDATPSFPGDACRVTMEECRP
ncbi:MAG: glucokinase [Rhodanobacteraceae bacterium]